MVPIARAKAVAVSQTAAGGCGGTGWRGVQALVSDRMPELAVALVEELERRARVSNDSDASAEPSSS